MRSNRKRLARIEAKCDRILSEVAVTRQRLKAVDIYTRMLDTARFMEGIQNGRCGNG